MRIPETEEKFCFEYRATQEEIIHYTEEIFAFDKAREYRETYFRMLCNFKEGWRVPYEQWMTYLEKVVRRVSACYFFLNDLGRPVVAKEYLGVIVSTQCPDGKEYVKSIGYPVHSGWFCRDVRPLYFEVLPFTALRTNPCPRCGDRAPLIGLFRYRGKLYRRGRYPLHHQSFFTATEYYTVCCDTICVIQNPEFTQISTTQS